MKSTVLIAAIVAGISLTALDASAAGRGEPREMPDFATLDADGKVYGNGHGRRRCDFLGRIDSVAS